MQIGGHSCVLFQTRLWAWQAERQALGWWRCTPRRALADGDDPVEGLSLRPSVAFLFMWPVILGLCPLGQALVQIASDVTRLVCTDDETQVTQNAVPSLL